MNKRGTTCQKGDLVQIIGSGSQGIRQLDLGSKLGIVDSERNWCWKSGEVVPADAYMVTLTSGYRTLVATEDVLLVPKYST